MEINNKKKEFGNQDTFYYSAAFDKAKFIYIEV